MNHAGQLHQLPCEDQNSEHECLFLFIGKILVPLCNMKFYKKI